MTTLEELKKARKIFIIEEEKKRKELSITVEEIVSTMESDEYVNKIFTNIISSSYFKNGIVEKGFYGIDLKIISLLGIEPMVQKAYGIKVDGYCPLTEIVYFNMEPCLYSKSTSVLIRPTEEYIKRFILPKFQGTGFEATISKNCLVIRLPEASLLVVDA
jgi:hypothetical protein